MPVRCQGRLYERLQARPDSVVPLRQAVVEFAGECGASTRQREDIALAVSEAVSNAVLHAYVGRDPGDVAVQARADGGSFEVVVCDDGIGMRPRLDSPGLGLGLPLIARVTQRCQVEDRVPGVGLRMTFAIG